MARAAVRRTAASVVAAALLAAGTAGSSAQAARKASGPPIVIGFANPLTGSEASYGQSDLKAVELAAAQINAQGGVLGRPIKILQWDTKGDPATGVAGANYFVTQNVTAVIGFFNSSISIPASVVLHRAGIPMVSGASTNPKLTEQGFKNVFRICGTDNFQGTDQALFLYKVLHVKTAVALNDEEVYGEGVSQYFQKEFTKLGGKILLSEGVSANQTDFSALLTKIKSLHPGAVEFGGFYTAAGLMVKQAASLGLKTIWMQDDGTIGPQYTQIGGKATVGTYLSSEPAPQDLASARTFVAQYVAKYHSQPTEFAGYNYDALRLIAHAIEVAKSTNHAAIIRALAKTKNFPGVTGPITFDAQGNNITAAYLIYKVLPNLSQVPVWNPVTGRSLRS
jgi:branched-chain amino acid transport system substrate-binding protein